MTVAITGATGVVGGAVLRHLQADGQHVRALVRSSRALPAEVEPVKGDVLDLESLKRCFAGVETVYHLAGVNQLCSRRPETMLRVNVEGTRLVTQAAGEARLVHTSSAAALGEAEGEIGDETTRPHHRWNSEYARTKWIGEQAVLSVSDRQDVVVVSPSSVQGPGRAGGTGKLLLGVMSGRLRTLVETRISIVDIDDCARGHLLAARKGVSGERYVLNSFSMSLSEAVRIIEGVVGRELGVRYLPPLVVRLMGAIGGGVFRVLRKDAPICSESVRTILYGHVYDGSRATRELGLAYSPADMTLRRLFDWARLEGKL
ncbi:MAG: NAD-dependent epimerase/dehydratase family protein [Acidimicrobiia bacterium]